VNLRRVAFLICLTTSVAMGGSSLQCAMTSFGDADRDCQTQVFGGGIPPPNTSKISPILKPKSVPFLLTSNTPEKQLVDPHGKTPGNYLPAFIMHFPMTVLAYGWFI
jgi:hypothetical protein